MLQRSSCWKSECHSGILFRTSGPDLHRNVFSCSCFYCLCPQDDIALEMRISRSLRLTNRIRASSGMSANNAANFCCDEMICECRDQPPEYLVRFGDPNISPCRAGKVFGVIGPDGSFRKCLHCIEELGCPHCFSAVEDSRAAGRKTDHVEIESPCPRRDKNRHFRFRNRK